MQTIEITDPVEARRCRYAQYRGEKATLISNGMPVTGMVRSVKEDKCSVPTRAGSSWSYLSRARRLTDKLRFDELSSLHQRQPHHDVRGHPRCVGGRRC